MRKLVWMPLALLALGAAGFFGFAPGYLEASMNKIDGQPLIPVSAEAKALHQTLQIVDLHSDTLMWDRNLLQRAKRGHEDLPRLQAGNVALQLFSSVTKTRAGRIMTAMPAIPTTSLRWSSPSSSRSGPGPR